MILVYHDIAFKSKHENTVDIFHFFLQMLALRLKRRQAARFAPPPNGIVITFDDGYKHVKKYALPILKFFKFPFELFVCEDFVKMGDEGNKLFLNSEDLKYLVKNGARLQYHSKSHPKLPEIEREEELKQQIVCPEFLKKLDPDGFEYFAYPSWIYNEKILEIIKQHYKGARSGNGHADNSPYAIDSIKVTNKTNLFKLL